MDGATLSGGSNIPPAEGGNVPPPAQGGQPADFLQQPSQLPLEKQLYSGFNYAVYLLTSYGWFIVLGVIVLALVWTSVKPAILRWLRKREERWEEANFDPDKAERFQDAMMKAREKMQRELDEKAKENELLTEEKEAEERDDRIRQWEQFKVVSKPRASKPKSTLRPSEYFPLGGSGGGGGYRPQRRTVGTGGGG